MLLLVSFLFYHFYYTIQDIVAVIWFSVNQCRLYSVCQFCGAAVRYNCVHRVRQKPKLPTLVILTYLKRSVKLGKDRYRSVKIGTDRKSVDQKLKCISTNAKFSMVYFTNMAFRPLSIIYYG